MDTILKRCRRWFSLAAAITTVSPFVFPSIVLAAPIDACLAPLPQISVSVAGYTVGAPYASFHPDECAIACVGSLSGDLPASTLANVCAQCGTISAIVAASPQLKDKAIGASLGAYITTTCAAEAAARAAQSAKELVCDKGPLGCCISTVKEGGADGNGKIEKEECYRKPPVYYGDCYCLVKDTVSPPTPKTTYKTCDQKCTDLGGQVDFTQGIGRYKAESEGAPDQPTYINQLCFKPEDCADAGGSFKGIDTACPANQGKCLAPEPTILLGTPILNNTQVTGIRDYVRVALQYALIISLIASSIFLIWGGFKYILGSSIFDIKTGKQTMIDAIVGLILTFIGITLLNFVNPATTTMDKLDVLMVNKLQYSAFNWCSDYKPAKPSKDLMFGYAGDIAGQTPYDKATFDKKVEDTECGKEYYPEGFVDKRCVGEICSDPGKSCMSCAAGLPECGDSKKGFVCVKASMTGEIHWADDRNPQKVILIGMCNWIQPASGQSFNSAKVASNLPEYLKAKLSNASQSGGGVTQFVLSGGPSDIQKLKSACANQGGLRGAVLGVIYNDPEIKSAATCAASVGAAAFTPTGIPGAAISCSSVDDAVIITKNECGKSDKFFGYADGTALSADLTDLQTAAYCGMRVLPGTGANLGSVRQELFNPSSYWTLEELEKAFASDGEALKCDFTFTKKNVPSDPGTNLMNGCKSGWCPAHDAECNKNN